MKSPEVRDLDLVLVSTALLHHIQGVHQLVILGVRLEVIQVDILGIQVGILVIQGGIQVVIQELIQELIQVVIQELPLEVIQEVRLEVIQVDIQVVILGLIPAVLLLLTTILLDHSRATKVIHRLQVMALHHHRVLPVGLLTTMVHLPLELLDTILVIPHMAPLGLTVLVLDLEARDLHLTEPWDILATVLLPLAPTLLLPTVQPTVLLHLPPPLPGPGQDQQGRVPTAGLRLTFRSWRTPSARWRREECRETPGTPRPSSSTIH